MVIDAFRLISQQQMIMGQEPRQTTSNVGHLHKPSIQALIHGLNKYYYSIAISYRKNALEQKVRPCLCERRLGSLGFCFVLCDCFVCTYIFIYH